MYDVDFERINSDQIRRVIKLVSVFEEKTHLQICEEVQSLGGPIVPTNSISKRKFFPVGFGTRLQAIVDRLEPADRDIIYRKIEALPEPELDDVYKGFGSRIAYSLDQWLGLNEIGTTQLAKDCANANGRYIIFRSPDGQKLLSARMNVFWRANSKLSTPGFVTIRSNLGKAEKITRGQAFTIGESVYTIGRIKRDSALRVSRLKKVPRNQRTDLYGLRVGTSPETERPYAHLVYAYQIKKSRGDALRKLLSCTDLEDPFLDEEIDNMDQIRRLLKAKGLTENGIVTQPIDKR